MRFTVGRKIGVGFGVLLFAAVGVLLLAYNKIKTTSDVLEKSVEQNLQVNKVEGVLNDLGLLRDNVRESKTLIVNWANIASIPEDLGKQKLISIKDTIVPLMLKPKLFASNLAEIDPKIDSTVKALFVDIEDLFTQYGQIQTLLPDLASYDDVMVVLEVNFLIAEDSQLATTANRVIQELNDLVAEAGEKQRSQRILTNTSFEETQSSSKRLLTLIITASLALIAFILVTAFVTTRSITGPVSQLKGMLVKMGKGIIPEKPIEPSNDEIGEMSVAMNNLVDGLKRTTKFAKEVGQSNFDYDYQPLSSDDTLGHGLLKMRDDLAENERSLEQKVIERTQEVVRQKGELEQQNHKIEELYKDVTDSIKYAKRLQDSILPPDHIIDNALPDSFVLFQPKDIVSGDFYWFQETQDKFHIASVDCTGHGVPGAFMSLVGANALNSAVKQGENDPAGILNELNKLTAEALNKEDATTKVRDGMDMSMLSFSKDMSKVEYAGANNPLYHVRDGELTQTKADKFAIGSFTHGDETYTNHNLEVKKGDLLYLFSDGYADQFGGVKGKKFMYRQFRELLLEIGHLPMKEQGKILGEKMDAWKGNYEQIDDILIIGVRLT